MSKNLRNIKCKLLVICLLSIFCNIVASAQITADFSVSQIKGCGNTEIEITDKSEGDISMWQWDFGNGIKRTETESGSYKFVYQPGEYTITLTVLDGVSSSVHSVDLIINKLPEPDFDVTFDKACVGSDISFVEKSRSESLIKECLWLFGDGGRSYESNPVYQYADGGEYAVQLMVTDESGCTATIKKESVVVIAKPLHVVFDVDKNISCSVPFETKFSSEVFNSDVEYKWDFGDGEFSLEASPSHIYTTAGSFDVSLTLSLYGCSSSKTISDFIQIESPDIKIEGETIVCVNSEVAFSAVSPQFFKSYAWDFNDGTGVSKVGKNVKTSYNKACEPVVTLQVVDFNGCESTIEKKFQVIQPVVDFSVDKSRGCDDGSDFNVTFTCLNENVQSFFWDFGDTKTMETILPNCEHNYVDGGSYDVSLQIVDENGCVGIKKVDSCVVKSLPNAEIDVLNKELCINKTISVKPQKDPYVSSVSWEFLYDRSKESSIQFKDENVVELQFNDGGSYPIQLTVSTDYGCVNTSVKELLVGNTTGLDVSIKKPTATQKRFCAGEQIDFVVSEMDGITQYKWSISSSAIANRIEAYVEDSHFSISLDTPGIYSVIVIPCQYSCPALSYDRKSITIKPPIAEFSFYPCLLCSYSDTLHFKPSDLAEADSYLWNFGDGNSILVESNGVEGHFKWSDESNTVIVADTNSINPHHVFPAENTYDVSLIATKEACSNSKTHAVTISEKRIGFITNESAACKGSNIQFIDTTTFTEEVVTNRIWTFIEPTLHDTTIVEADSIYTHTFYKAGNYKVGLTLFTNTGCQRQIVRDDVVTIYPDPIITEFKAKENNSGCADFTVYLQAQSTSEIYKYIWSYGDGNVDTTNESISNKHIYSIGNYEPFVQVIDSKNCKSISEPIIISATKPYTNFKIPIDGCPNTEIIPEENSVGSNLSYSWSWGDGTVSVGKNVSHMYAEMDKSYTVTLTVKDENDCEESVAHKIFIHKPKADFSALKTSFVCPPAEVSFVNESYGENLTFQWIFEDESDSKISVKDAFYVYNSSGTYDVSLIVTDEYGCSDKMTKSDFISIKGPVGNLFVEPENGCTYSQITFSATEIKNAEKYSWIFGDGQFQTTTTESITHIYENGNFYTPSLVITDENGCEISFLGNIIKISEANPDFTGGGMICEGNSIVLQDASTSYPDPIESWLWTIIKNGSKETFESKNVTSVLESGSYDIQLQTKVNDCLYTKASSNYVMVQENPVVKITPEIVEMCDFTTTDLKTVVVSGDDGKGPYQALCSWEGNGIEVSSEDALLAKYTAKSYDENDVAVDYTSSYGCKAQQLASKSITVYNIPEKPASVAKYYCLHDLASEEDLLTMLSVDGSLTWYTSEYDEILGTPIPQTSLVGTQTFYVTQSLHGCESDKAQVLVIVNPLPVPEIIAEEDITCEGNTVSLELTEQYKTQHWSCFPKDYLSSSVGNSVEIKPTAPADTYTITVAVEDENNCKSEVNATKQIILYPVIDVKMEASKTAVEMLEDIYFINKTDTTKYREPIVWSWFVEDSCFENIVGVPYVFNEAGEYEITLVGYTHEECKSTDTKSVKVLPEVRVPNVFTPNGDGINDIFFEGMPDAELIIINRWGQELYRGNEGWDGTYNGKEMSAGTYFYMISLPTGKKYDGPLMLIRN
ncbi:MAG: PKD domain-containing protein [Bacteroidales bacterium]|nr:PKD domain-containing protein [Bacteroidales bacterium]